MTILTIPTPDDFRFWTTVCSHGWCDLLPFQCNDDSRTLERLHQLADGTPVRLVFSEAQPGTLTIRVESSIAALTPTQQAEIETVAQRCFNFDHDLSDFHVLLRGHPRYRWIDEIGAGRMLGSPSVWEDLVKTLMTTNTTWNMTKQMVARVVALGTPYAAGGFCFPTPERIAALSLDDLNTAVRAGYRGAYLHELAVNVASGKVEIESWRDPDLPGDEVYRRVKSLKGFGDYAAGSVLKLLGHFDRLATDSECRAVYKNSINGGQAGTDKEIAAYYEPFGRWRSLVQWMDVMESSLRSTV